MASRPDGTRPIAAIAAGGMAGLAGGLLASWLMVKFQQSVWPPPKGDRGSSTAKLAKDVATWTGSEPLGDRQAATEGTAIHYALGAVLGLAYGGVAVVEPRVTVAGGILFGVATELVIDQTIVPALGLANPFWKCPIKWHARGLAAHIVFGMATEATRRGAVRLTRTALHAMHGRLEDGGPRAGLVDHSQKMTVAARATAEKKAVINEF